MEIVVGAAILLTSLMANDNHQKQWRVTMSIMWFTSL